MTVDKRGDALLSALVGLVRAASKQGKTPETDAALLRGLCALGAPEAEQRAAAEAAHAEKNRIVPDCARCAMPCGSTADGDMQAAWSAQEPVRAEKAALLAAIRTARRRAGRHAAGKRAARPAQGGVRALRGLDPRGAFGDARGASGGGRRIKQKIGERVPAAVRAP